MRDPRRAYRVVDDFEQELCDFTGAPFAVSVDSATNGIFLALLHERLVYGHDHATMVRHSYVGVLWALRNAGYTIDWTDEPWTTHYRIQPTRVVDSARRIARDMYEPGTLTVLSHHAAKQLALGRGGTILTDDADAAEWLRRARADGRAPGDTDPYAVAPGHHMYLPPPTAALGLWILSRWTHDPAPLPPDPYPDLSVL